MSVFSRIARDLKQTPKDEREQQVQQSSSWTATIILFAVYIVIGMVYTIRGEQVPWSTQVLFLAPLIAFAYLTIKYEGYHFRIPGVAETSKTLDQPAMIRSIPWLIIAQAILLYPIQDLATALHAYFYLNHSLPSLAASIFMPIIIGFTLSYYIAGQVKRGDTFWVGLLRIGNFLNVVGTVFVVTMSSIPHAWERLLQVTPPDSTSTGLQPIGAVVPISVIISAWMFYVLAWHGKQIVMDGKSYVSDKGKPYTLEEKLGALITRKKPEYYLFCSIGFYTMFNVLNTLFGQDLSVVLTGVIGFASFFGFLFMLVGAADLWFYRKDDSVKKGLAFGLIALIIAANILVEQYLMK